MQRAESAVSSAGISLSNNSWMQTTSAGFAFRNGMTRSRCLSRSMLSDMSERVAILFRRASQRRPHERGEQRVRRKRTSLKFRMELAPEIEGMLGLRKL